MGEIIISLLESMQLCCTLLHRGESTPFKKPFKPPCSEISKTPSAMLSFVPISKSPPISNPALPLSTLRFKPLKWRRRMIVIRAARSDYYSTLNLSRTATLKEIKTAYRTLARKVCFNSVSLFGCWEKQMCRTKTTC